MVSSVNLNPERGHFRETHGSCYETVKVKIARTCVAKVGLRQRLAPGKLALASLVSVSPERSPTIITQMPARTVVRMAAAFSGRNDAISRGTAFDFGGPDVVLLLR